MKCVLIAKTAAGYALVAYHGRQVVAAHTLDTHDDAAVAMALSEVQAAHCGPDTAPEVTTCV